MASSNKTPHYGLSQFAPTDKPAWQGDYNSDMKKIDNGIYAAQNKADSLDASVSEAENKATQALEKAEAAEDAAENAAALAQEAKTTADNISGDLSGKVNKAGDTMTGPLVLPGDPTEDNQAATKKYVDEHGGGAAGDYLPLSGGTLTGPLTLAADPSTAMQAATKQYVDDAVAGGASSGSATKLTANIINQNWVENDQTVFLVNESLVLIYAWFKVKASDEISEGSPLFSVILPDGYTMVEPGLVGVPGWSTSSTKTRKFDFNPVNEGSKHTIQVVYSTQSENAVDINEQIYIIGMVQVRKS